jgi:hypothetical protein
MCVIVRIAVTAIALGALALVTGARAESNSPAAALKWRIVIAGKIFSKKTCPQRIRLNLLSKTTGLVA